MRVTVRLFAGLREHAGTGRRDVDLGDGARVADVWPALELGDEPAGLALRREPRLRRARPGLGRGGRGRAHTACFGRRVSPHRGPPSTSPRSWQRSSDERAGAMATFIGTVRAQSRGRQVVAARVRGLRRDGRERHGRSGRAARGAATTSAPSRSRTGWGSARSARRAWRSPSPPRTAQDALAACKDAIDTLKETVPLWKKEVYEGGEEWIGRGS